MLKKIILSASLLFTTHIAFSQGVAINEDNSSANASAILDIKSTTKGMLAPRMSAAQKTAISSPATGLLIYQTDGTAGFYYYNGSVWTFINAAGVAGQDGLNSLSKTTTEPAGVNCTNGGIKVEYGLDINTNGTLDTGEENATLTKFVCNGADGATGATGATGAAGQGVPTGGTTGQVLTKIDGTDYNTQWAVAGGSSLPNQTGNAGKYLTTDGTNASWAAVQGTGIGIVKDANDVTLGKAIDIDAGGITILTSTGYIYFISWAAVFPDGQIYYSTSTCGVGTKWLNAGSTSPRPRNVKFLVHDPPTGDFYILDNADANGMAVNVPFTANSIWNYGSCSSGSMSNGGWLLAPITKAAAGIPATITPPLTVE
ncbi:hypothetical protein ACE193_02730 [Bernardetia sp. OM2101]|uniref:DUF7151 family protein n=1 Tax=Bernardetia sp. OM2101 TaxID=3344876 RepID=UPI0035D01385